MKLFEKVYKSKYFLLLFWIVYVSSIIKFLLWFSNGFYKIIKGEFMSIEDLEFLENFFKTEDILEANKKLEDNNNGK